MQGRIHSIETFGTVDGPGIRYVIFLQGCNFRCAYCHNPDTWDCNGGKLYSVDDIVSDISKYTRYIEGITVSGGEPLLQIDFLIELFDRVKSLGVSTCLDTSGSIFDRNNPKIMEKIAKLLDLCDLVMLDIKHIDNDKHIDLTGKPNTNVLDFARYLSDIGKDIWLRYVLVPGINDDIDILSRWYDFSQTLSNVRKIELLPYHRLATYKYKDLGLVYRLENTPEPSKEQIVLAKKILRIEEGENI